MTAVLPESAVRAPGGAVHLPNVAYTATACHKPITTAWRAVPVTRIRGDAGCRKCWPVGRQP